MLGVSPDPVAKDDGGNDDLTQGYKVNDIENVVLSQSNGVPVLIKTSPSGVVTR